jgi:hypothetical protein
MERARQFTYTLQQKEHTTNITRIQIKEGKKEQSKAKRD